MIIVIKNINRYLINWVRFGSECIYHIENSMIDHVTYRATGKKMTEKKSNFRLSENLIDPIEIHCQFVIISSVPELKKEDRGIRLMKNAHLMHDVTYLGKSMCFVILVNEMTTGNTRRATIRKIEAEMMLITFIWSCTKSLAPKTNGSLLSYKSKKAARLSSEA